jgi:hypothetical protein
MRAVLDLKNTAFYLDTTTDAIRDLVKHGRIPYKKRGDKLIFLISDLDAWLRALPGPNAADFTDPARFKDTSDANSPRMTPDSTIPVTPIKLSRGPRTHVSAASAQEQSR